MKQGIIPSVSHDASAVSSSLSSTTATTMPVNHPAVATAAASSITVGGGGVPLGTYEATMAALSQQQQPDPIHWMNHVTFREHRYRLLHHQCGTIYRTIITSTTFTTIVLVTTGFGSRQIIGFQ